MAVEYINNGNSDGAILGHDANDKVGLHGATPSDQYAAIADVATTAATNSSPYGFAEAQANALVANVNSILAALREKGIIASS